MKYQHIQILLYYLKVSSEIIFNVLINNDDFKDFVLLKSIYNPSFYKISVENYLSCISSSIKTSAMVSIEIGKSK